MHIYDIQNSSLEDSQMQDIWNAFEIKKSPNENNHIYMISIK